MNAWNQIKSRWSELEQRERLFLMAGGAALIVALLYFALVAPLSHSKAQLASRVQQERADLVWMRGAAARIKAMRGTRGTPSALKGSLLATVDASARDAGISGAVKSLQQDSGTSVRARLEGAAFDKMLTWLGGLHRRYGVRVESIDLERAEGSGQINASVVLSHE